MSQLATSQEKGAEINRRGFLARAAAATLTLAPGVTLSLYGSEAAANASASSRWGLLIDVNKCRSDCNDCVTACSDENGWKSTGNP